MQCSAFRTNLILFVVGHLIAALRAAAIPKTSINCAAVKSVINSSFIASSPLTSQGLISEHFTRLLKVYSTADLDICPSAETCCTKHAENVFKEAAKKDFNFLLSNVSASLHSLLINNLNTLRDKFRAMILLSENATLSMLSKNYTKLGSSSMIPTSKLFTSLITYVSGKEVDVQHSVNNFFDEMFPEIYQKLIKSRHKEVNAEFVDCLRDAQPDISAFGNIPLQLSLQLEKSFEFAKTVLQSIQVAIDVLNRTLNFRMSNECTNAFVKLTYCSTCSGLHNVRPCSGLCLNVARGCVAQLAELDKPWNEFVIAFERLSTSIIGYQNAENVLAAVDSKISEAFKYAVDNGQEIAKRVKVACGHPKRYLREATTTETSQHNDNNLRPSLPFPSLSSSSLYVKLQAFVYQLVESKGFFTNLGDSLCQEDYVSSNTEVNCWNGATLGEYTKSIAGIGIEAQKFNSELPASSMKSSEISVVVEKLKQMRDSLRSKVRSVPESDSYVMNDGSGSGQDFKYNIITDDEDYSDLSGSGTDKSDSPSTDNNFDFSDDTLSTVNVGGTATSIRLSAVIVFVSMLSVIQAVFHCD